MPSYEPLPLANDTNDAAELDALRAVFFAAERMTDISLRLCSHRTQAHITRCGCDDETECQTAQDMGFLEISAQAKVWKAVEKARPLVRMTALNTGA